MLEYVGEVVAEAEKIAGDMGLVQVFERLRTLSVEDFGELLLNMPNQAFPRLSRLLPAMASEEHNGPGLAIMAMVCCDRR